MQCITVGPQVFPEYADSPLAQRDADLVLFWSNILRSSWKDGLMVTDSLSWKTKKKIP